MNAFVTERNIDIYLSRAFETWAAEERDVLLRLVLEQEGRMGAYRLHLQENERRLSECGERLKRHKELIAKLESDGHDAARAHFLLATYEQILALLAKHREHLLEVFERAKL